MKHNNLTSIYWSLLLTLYAGAALGQGVKNPRMLSFEEAGTIPSISGTGSQFVRSDAHYKEGEHALKWSYQPGGVLCINRPLSFEPKDSTGKDLYLSTFAVWVYNETPANNTVRFEFLKDNTLCCSFPFELNFKGWRAVWACYERDMEGTPQEGMNAIRLVAPNAPGTLYLDKLVTAAKTDPRHQTPDYQAPFVNKQTKSHWLVLYKNSLLKPDIDLTPVNEQQKGEMQDVEARFHNWIYTPSPLTNKEVEQIRNAYSFYHISQSDSTVKGVPLFFAREAEIDERVVPNWEYGMYTAQGVELRRYFDLMHRVALAYHNAPEGALKEEMGTTFLSLYRHVTDQGVAYGSCMGNFTHYGYSFRSLYPAYFLMKSLLQKEGLLTEAVRTMQWYAITNEVYPAPTVNGIDMDSFNTQASGRMASILMMEDTPEKLQYLRSLSRWIDYGCRPAPGLAGAFKKDGGAFHHQNLYPAYAVGGLDGATEMIYLLSKTQFSISQEAHQTVKNALLAMRFYCNKRHFPLAMSGRHPDGKGKLIPNHYATMTLAGSPDGRQEMDGEMASAYLRLVSQPNGSKSEDPEYMPQVSSEKEQQLAKALLANGFQAEETPEGNWAFGYGCVSIQRRDNWSAVVRGHSRYLWAAEHYLGANLYGRYLAHGSLQIMTAPAGQEVTPLSGGWQEAGFNWARIPGTTAITLPIEKLEARILNVDQYSGIEEMLYSDEAFAGGLSQAGNGNFGMKLHEHDKYNGSHRARKSFHLFGSKIICLGSDIENQVADYPTETTLFQLALSTEEGREYWKQYQPNGNVWIDHLGTGYYYPASEGKKVNFERHFPQYSRNEETRKVTEGDWVTLTFTHGKAPKAEGYEYAVLPQTTQKELASFAKKPTYRVLQRNREAHIVHSSADSLTSYVLFETPQAILPQGLLLRADTSCLVMVKEDKDKPLLTVCQPDLALYRGKSDEAFDAQGKRIERSIYSRPWIANESGQIAVTLTLRGQWNVEDTPHAQLLSSDKKQTIIRVNCQDGASRNIQLVRQ